MAIVFVISKKMPTFASQQRNNIEHHNYDRKESD